MIIWLLAVAYAGVGEEVPPMGDAATLADGAGIVLSVGAGSPDLLQDLPEIPLVPRVGLAGFLEPADAVLFGVRAGGAGLLSAEGVEPAVEGAVAVALGSRERTVWTGGEVGASVTPGDAGTPDAALIAAATFGVDVDPLSSIGFRLGLLAGPSGIEQRHGIVGTYRPAPRSGLSLGVHGGVAEGQHGLTTQFALHQRIGPLGDPWTEPVIEVEDRITVETREHPELRCEEGDVPVGRPPPLGLEGWCARVARNGTQTRHGTYVRWHDMLTVAERGQYTDGLRSGDWEAYDHEGNVRERGGFVAGKEEGQWITFFADGSVMEEGGMRAGERDGRWRFYNEKGHLEVDGAYANGDRVGLWVDYDDKGRSMRERGYEAGRLIRDERLFVSPNDPSEVSDTPEVRNADGTVPTGEGDEAPTEP